MSNSVRPRRWQPTRLPRPWDSPGNNTGVACHFLLQCMKVKSESEVTQSCPTLCDPMDCSLPGSSVHGIFQARVLEWAAIAFSAVNHREWLFLFFHFHNNFFNLNINMKEKKESKTNKIHILYLPQICLELRGVPINSHPHPNRGLWEPLPLALHPGLD